MSCSPNPQTFRLLGGGNKNYCSMHLGKMLCRKLAAMIIIILFLLQVKELQYRVLDQELNKWKREQQLSGNGAPFSNNLDTIQKW